MKIYEVQERTPQLLQSLVAVWEASVRATHRFLSDAAVERIKQSVPQALQDVAHLIVAEREPGRAVAFLGTAGCRLEMLFLAPEERGKGLGRRLVQEAIQNYGVREVTVNEENPQAVGFYQHLGFRAYRRSALDEAGDPYPLLYMKL